MFSALQPINNPSFPLRGNIVEEDSSRQCNYSVPVWRLTGGAVITSVEWIPILPLDTTLWLRIRSVLDCIISEGLLISNISDVRDYLFRHKDIVDLTRRACRRAKDVFESEPGAQLVLELERDPEFGDEHLTLEVRLGSYEDVDIWGKIDQVSAEFDKQISGESGWLLITTDYRHPQ